MSLGAVLWAVLLLPSIADAMDTMQVRLVGMSGTQDAWRVEGMNLYSDSGCSMAIAVGTAFDYHAAKLEIDGSEEYSCGCHGGELSTCPCGDHGFDLGGCSYFASATCRDGGSCQEGRCAVVFTLPAGTNLRCVSFYDNTLGSTNRFMSIVRVEYQLQCGGQNGGWKQWGSDYAMTRRDFKTSQSIALPKNSDACATTPDITSSPEITPSPTAPTAALHGCSPPYKDFVSACKSESCLPLTEARFLDIGRHNLRSPVDHASICVHRNHYASSCTCDDSSTTISSSEERSAYLEARLGFAGLASASASHESSASYSEDVETRISSCICRRELRMLDTRSLRTSPHFAADLNKADSIDKMKAVVEMYGTHFISQIQDGGVLLMSMQTNRCSKAIHSSNKLSGEAVYGAWDGGVEVDVSKTLGKEYEGVKASVVNLGGSLKASREEWEDSLVSGRLTAVFIELTDTADLVPEGRMRDLWKKAASEMYPTTIKSPTVSSTSAPPSHYRCSEDGSDVDEESGTHSLAMSIFCLACMVVFH